MPRRFRRPQSSRSSVQSAPYYMSNTTHGWSLIRNISHEAGEHKCALGVAKRVYDSVGEFAGYQAIEAAQAESESLPSSASITLREMMAFAGTAFPGGKSRTARMGDDEARRMGRINPATGLALPAEDYIELVIAKVAMFSPRMRLSAAV